MIELEIFSQPGADKENEDYVWHAEIVPGVSLIIVCDGMGGLSHGAEAANLITRVRDKRYPKKVESAA